MCTGVASKPPHRSTCKGTCPWAKPTPSRAKTLPFTSPRAADGMRLRTCSWLRCPGSQWGRLLWESKLAHTGFGELCSSPVWRLEMGGVVLGPTVLWNPSWLHGCCGLQEVNYPTLSPGSGDKGSCSSATKSILFLLPRPIKEGSPAMLYWFTNICLKLVGDMTDL